MTCLREVSRLQHKCFGCVSYCNSDNAAANSAKSNLLYRVTFQVLARLQACSLRRVGLSWKQCRNIMHHAPCVRAGCFWAPNIYAFFLNYTHPTMAPASTSRDPDLEAQRDRLQPHRASYLLYSLGLNVLTIFGKRAGRRRDSRDDRPSV